MKEYNYTLYTESGEKIRDAITAKNEDSAIDTLNAIKNNRSDVEFATIDSLDLPCDYDWNEECQAWQSRMFE